MSIVRGILAAGAITAVLPSSAWALTKQEAEEKIQNMEQEIMFFKEQFYDVETELDKFMRISGYMDMEYLASDQKGSASGFRLHHFSLFFRKKIAEKWRFFSEIEYEDGPRYTSKDETITVSDTDTNAQTFATLEESEGGIFAEAFNITYELTPALALRFGREFAPVGLWNLDHYPPYLATQQAPQHIRRIFPRTNDGISAFGSKRFTNTFLNYHFYLGNGEGNSGRGDGNPSKSVGTRLAITLPVLSQTEVGFSYNHDQQNDSRTKNAFGLHTRIKANDLTVQAEYATNTFEAPNGSKLEHLGYYLQAMYDWGAWGFGYRYDYYDDNTASGAESPEFGVTNSLILNYHAAKNTVFKFEYHMEAPEEAKIGGVGDDTAYSHAIASIAVHLGE